MKRCLVLALLGAVGACARGAPVASPAPAAVAVVQGGAAAADTTPAAAPVAAGIPPAPAIDTSLDLAVELAQERQLEADSAADAAVLQQLADDSSGGDEDGITVGGAKGLGDASWDIDVATYGRHDRVQYWLDFFQGPARERMGVWLTRLPRYESFIRSTLQAHQLPTDLVYLALIESGYSNSAVSRASATGMWQFMRGTARGYGLRVDSWVDERRDPYKSTEAAAEYLADLYKQFGSLYLAAAAYNAGGGSIARSLRRMPDSEADSVVSDATFFQLYDTRLLHRETADYVPKLIAAALIAKEPERYGFTVPSGLGPTSFDSLVVPGMVGLDVVARLAHVTVAALRDLNPQYLRLVTPPEGRSVIRLPAGTGEETAVAFARLPASQRVSFVHHVVRRGESISVIARRYHVSQAAVLAANPRVQPRRIRPGQTLVIPTGGGASPLVARRLAEPVAGSRRTQEFHVVRRGESVSVIAQRYEVSERSIRAWNHLNRKGTIRIGQRLRIAAPGKAAPRPRVTPAARKTATLAAKAGKPSAKSPAKSGKTRVHVIRRGETLTGLARRYGVSLQALKDANGMHGNVKLRAGASIKIPAG